MLRLYWARNDGMTGACLLSARASTTRSPPRWRSRAWAAGSPADAIKPDARIPPGQIDLALAKASPEPRTLDDAKLWEDWLAFLQGAAENGGLVVQ